MQTVVQALSEPRRREILQLVRDRERAAGEIAAHFEVTRPTISQHLTLLKNAGLITERREGTRRMYRARPEGLAELQSFLDGFWEDGLERLKVAAEQEHRKGRVARAAKRN
jgi:DNA-binding transcriptional ArsR family regulator